MPRCPNCGRETLRTEDWACQWCGSPLLSGAFKQIDKTFRQLQEERSLETKPVLEAEPEPEPAAEIEVEPAPRVPEPEPEIQPEPETPPPSMPEPETTPEPAAEIEAEVKAESQIDTSLEPESESVDEAEPAAQAEPVAVAEAEVEAAQEPSPETEPEVKTAPDKPAAVTTLEPDTDTGIFKATVEELNANFNSDKSGTNNKLLDKVLQITGTVEKVVARDHLDIFYIILGARGPSTWQVRCTFSREHGASLSRLDDGQTVTVQGTYVGYERNIILKECSLV
jgi:hypothetical protein